MLEIFFTWNGGRRPSFFSPLTPSKTYGWAISNNVYANTVIQKPLASNLQSKIVKKKCSSEVLPVLRETKIVVENPKIGFSGKEIDLDFYLQSAQRRLFLFVTRSRIPIGKTWACKIIGDRKNDRNPKNKNKSITERMADSPVANDGEIKDS